MQTRWQDNDHYGHVNNVAFYAFFDSAVNGWLMEVTRTDIRTLAAIGVVAETSCRFHRSVRFPDQLEVGLRLERLGRSSVIYELGVFRAGEPEPVATGRFVHVYVQRDTRAVTDVPETIRTALQRLIA